MSRLSLTPWFSPRVPVWELWPTVALVLLFLSSCGPLLGAEKTARPLSHEAVAQVWLGWSEDGLDLFRLDLKADATGMGGSVFGDEQPRLFRITSWKYEPERIEMTAAPLAGEGSDIGQLRGAFVGLEMKLTVYGRGWHHRVMLRRESDLELKWHKLKGAMLGTPDPSSGY